MAADRPDKEFIKKRTKRAMDRNVAFWKREMSDSILVEFGAEGDVTLDAVKTEGVVCNDIKPLYDNVPKMLKDFEKEIEIIESTDNWKICDDNVRIPIAWPELQFGNGIAGAIFGGKLITTSTKDHTYTFNEPVVSDWKDVYKLKFEKDNEWVKRILNSLEYFIQQGRKNFLVRPFFIYEGADFIVSIRGTTRAFYDLIDNPKELKFLYDLGRKTGIEFFEMKRKIIREHNEKILDHRQYSKMAPIHAVPMLDMDAYALCSPEIFEKIGFENKQKILDYFKGGTFYIHALGRHIVPIAAQLNNLTELWLFDDPKCPRYFDDRRRWRKETYDIPLEMYCNFDEFIKALDEKSLPGGVKYNVFTSELKLLPDELNELINKVKKYHTNRLAGKPKK